MSVNLTPGIAVSLGARRDDPNLRLIHENVTDHLGNLYQYRLMEDGSIRRLLIRLAVPRSSISSLSPSKGEGFYGSGRGSRRLG